MALEVNIWPWDDLGGQPQMTNYPVLYPNYPVLYPNYPILYPYYPKTPKIRNIWPLYGLEMQKINFME